MPQIKCITTREITPKSLFREWSVRLKSRRCCLPGACRSSLPARSQHGERVYSVVAKNQD